MCHLDIVVVKKLWQPQRMPVTAACRGRGRMGRVPVCVCEQEGQKEGREETDHRFVSLFSFNPQVDVKIESARCRMCPI